MPQPTFKREAAKKRDKLESKKHKVAGSLAASRGARAERKEKQLEKLRGKRAAVSREEGRRVALEDSKRKAPRTVGGKVEKRYRQGRRLASAASSVFGSK